MQTPIPVPAAEILLSCAEALRMVQDTFASQPTPPNENIPLEQALGRVLAEAVHADRDQPPFPRSTRDGFAVRAADLESSRTLRIVGAIRAGEEWTGAPLQPGEALEIMTGAPAPAGADAVLMVEHAKRDGDILLPSRTLSPGENIVPQGAEARSGDILLRPGVRLGPAEIALAASVGRHHLSVYARPTVAILSTGDELVSVEQTPGPQQIRNSNAYALAALVRQNGGEPRLLPVAADTRESLERSIARAAGCDMLVLSGGVSAGKYDLVEPVLASRGAQFLFTGVRMQPGKPAVFGRMTDVENPPEPASATRTQWIFGLPGNPVSVQVTAMLFALPMLRALGGEVNPQPAFAAAQLTQPVQVSPGLTRFLPARLTAGLEGTVVEPTGWKGSGDLHSNARANCYLVVPPDAVQLDKGTHVQVLLR
ncbi:molybdopterin molybdotransferase MoeA [Terriglobus aquaticus]|uniref:Molybdopterin molybdenumtransferase n=1 Tax=Terriglobus aquaticus TaxID=940139 RepID=A0ABW9KND1_9BACT|nr:gephyrin-like molybdotransferase Glp [Terriglobus aquaticus]